MISEEIKKELNRYFVVGGTFNPIEFKFLAEKYNINKLDWSFTGGDYYYFSEHEGTILCRTFYPKEREKISFQEFKTILERIGTFPREVYIRNSLIDTGQYEKVEALAILEDIVLYREKIDLPLDSNQSFNVKTVSKSLIREIPTDNMNSSIIFGKISEELLRANDLHGEMPDCMFKQSCILVEEVGEVAKAVNDYHSGDGGINNITQELIQTAAMCVKMLNKLGSSINLKDL